MCKEKEIELTERVNRAVELFKSGFNCSQSVFAAFSDQYGITEELALKLSASFGGGIGRMRQTCGAACGLFMLLGLETGATNSIDRDKKAHNYHEVQLLAEKLKEVNGSIICSELLGLDKKEKVSSIPEERNMQYYKKRPCSKIVENTAKVWVNYLLNKD